jgi:RNA-splicing ligase RtcB
MKEVKGKYGTAKIFTDLVDDKSIEQVKILMDQEFVKDCKVRMMPDIHAGAGCVIGTTMAIKDRVCPNLVGVDIGCGMLCVKLVEKEDDIDLAELDRVIREFVPSGFNVRSISHEYMRYVRLNELDCYAEIDVDRAYKSLGTLGGGNHFIELAHDEEGCLYLVIHTGSRHLGKEVSEYYQDCAVKVTKEAVKITEKRIIDKLKSEGRETEIADTIEEFKKSSITPPKELSCLAGPLFYDYIHDMKIIQEYADWNRRAIADVITLHMGLHIDEHFATIHNYIDTDEMILRKGAVSAKDGEVLLIPMNMRDGSLICMGKGNPDWNCSAPHGAGRLMSRTEAKEEFSLNQFRKSMDGIYTTSVGFDTIDECPMAYKPMESIVENVGDTVDILKVIKPIYNYKAGE